MRESVGSIHLCRSIACSIGTFAMPQNKARQYSPEPDWPAHGSCSPGPDWPTHGSCSPGPDWPAHGSSSPEPDWPAHGSYSPEPDWPAHGSYSPEPDWPAHGSCSHYDCCPRRNISEIHRFTAAEEKELIYGRALRSCTETEFMLIDFGIFSVVH